MYLITSLLLLLIYASSEINGQKKKHCPDNESMVKCVEDAEQDWEVDRDVSDKRETWCCFRRQAFQCQLSVGEVCDGFDRKMFDLQINFTRQDIDADCAEFPASKCTGLQWWAITLIVIACIAVVSILAFGIYMVFIRPKRRLSGKQ